MNLPPNGGCGGDSGDGQSGDETDGGTVVAVLAAEGVARLLVLDRDQNVSVRRSVRDDKNVTCR
jgi:hypothetical protein